MMDQNKIRENQLTARFVRKVDTVHTLNGSKRWKMVNIQMMKNKYTVELFQKDQTTYDVYDFLGLECNVTILKTHILPALYL